MSTISRQITTEITTVPKVGIGILAGILVFGTFVVGYDYYQQGYEHLPYSTIL